MEARETIAPAEFETPVGQARLIISHAGIGTVLTAARCKKPILLMPRRADMGERRNDHQLATVRKLAGRPGIVLALDESELAARIDQGLTLDESTAVQSPTARQLHTALAAFIENRPF
jgi:UDP-N-acetylglucosamine transferase subunit ALG13